MGKATARQIERVLQLDREIADAETRVVVAWAEIEQKQQQGALRQGRKENMMKSAAERARVHKYCQKAPLLERGQIIDFDDAMLMGAILKMAEMLADGKTRYQCWVAGHAEFLRAGKTRRKPASLTVRFDTKPKQAVLDIMNAAKFSYDAASMAWHGEGDIGHARELVSMSGVGGTAEAVSRKAKSKVPTASRRLPVGTTSSYLRAQPSHGISSGTKATGSESATKVASTSGEAVREAVEEEIASFSHLLLSIDNTSGSGKGKTAGIPSDGGDATSDRGPEREFPEGFRVDLEN